MSMKNSSDTIAFPIMISYISMAILGYRHGHSDRLVFSVTETDSHRLRNTTGTKTAIHRIDINLK